MEHERMFADYFVDFLVYGAEHFKKCYRMQSSLFQMIMDRVCECDDYFVQKHDACGLWGLSSIPKCTIALRMLAYEVTTNATDEYCQIGESTAMESMKHFCKAIRVHFGDHHLGQPTREDFETQLSINAECGFLGIFASLDCMHYKWKNCPLVWQGDFGDRDGDESIILESIANQSLHIWHVFLVC